MFSGWLRSRSILLILLVFSMVAMYGSLNYSKVGACGDSGSHKHYPALMQVTSPQQGDQITKFRWYYPLQVEFIAELISCGHDWDLDIRIYLEDSNTGNVRLLFNGNLLSKFNYPVFSDTYRVTSINHSHNYRIRVETNEPNQMYSDTFKFGTSLGPVPLGTRIHIPVGTRMPAQAK